MICLLFLDHTNVSLYADDTVLYCFSSSSTDMESRLNSDLFKIVIWLQENKLTLNLSKTKFMVMGSDRKLHNFPQLHLTVMDKEINCENHVKYLGVTISSNMTWSDHIESISSTISQRLGLLFRIKHLLLRSSCLLYYNSLILPIFDHADVICGTKITKYS